jgi:hypothetical protein
MYVNQSTNCEIARVEAEGKRLTHSELRMPIMNARGVESQPVRLMILVNTYSKLCLGGPLRQRARIIAKVPPKLKKINVRVSLAMMLVATEFIKPWIISKIPKTPTISNFVLSLSVSN